MSGLSTSTNAKPRALLSKPEFLARLDARSRKRYGEPFGEALLNDLIKDGLIEAAVRFENDGLSPVYGYGATHYRRALQLSRLRSIGVSRRDAVRVLLFARGSIPGWMVREPLTKEFRRLVTVIENQIRSAYFDNWKSVPVGRRKVVQRELGSIDPSILATGFVAPPELILSLFRHARQSDFDFDLSTVSSMISSGIENRTLAFDDFVTFATVVFSGFFQTEANSDRNDRAIRNAEFATSIEQIIERASEADFHAAVLFARFLIKPGTIRRVFMGLGLGTEPAWSALEAKFRDSVRQDAHWACFLIVLALRMHDAGYDTDEVLQYTFDPEIITALDIHLLT